LPAALIENELFGHEKGAYTGADAQKIGRFELADGGTIFLDEIADLTFDLQSKLLRVIEEGRFEHVGGLETIEVDVRIIAATNGDLEAAIEAGRFREDLFYRLNVFPIKMPPLRYRKVDVPPLVGHFVQKYGAKLGKRIDVVPKKLMTALRAYHWPGNVRELENVIERCVILSQDNRICIDEFFEMNPKIKSGAKHRPITLREVERAHILGVLKETGWVIEGKNGAATQMDIHPATLRSRMKKLGIKRPQQDR
jgi:transcriptional regulator with GAF, ATPase, and Fis domain